VDETGAWLALAKQVEVIIKVLVTMVRKCFEVSFEQARKMRYFIKPDRGAGFGVAGHDFLSGKAFECDAFGVILPVEVVNDGVNGLLAGDAGLA
jgi:hypothetical protein